MSTPQSPECVLPVRFALKYQPPTLVLFYRDLSSGKARRRSMPLRGLAAEKDIAKYADNLMHHSRHAVFLSKTPQTQLVSLLYRVKEVLVPVSNRTPSKTTQVHTSSSLGSGFPPLSVSFGASPSIDHAHEQSTLDIEFESALVDLLNGDSSTGREDSKENQQQGDGGGMVQPTSRIQGNNAGGRRLAPLKLDRRLETHLETGGSPDHELGSGLRQQLGPPLPPPPRLHPSDDFHLVPESALGLGRHSAASTSLPLPASHTVTERKLTPGDTASPTEAASIGNLVGTFPTEVPDYTPEFESEEEKEEEEERKEEERNHRPPGLPAEEKTLSFGIEDSPSEHFSVEESLSVGSFSGEDFRQLSPTGIFTGDNSQMSDGEGRKGRIGERDEDLNKVSEQYLAKRKAEMSLTFEANRLHPGDEGYEYDKQVEFGVGGRIESSGWDSDTESEF